MSEEEVKQEASEQPAQEQQEQSQQEKQSPKHDPETNWAQSREALRLQKMKIEELEAKLQQLSQPPPQEEVDEFADLEPDDYMTVNNARRLAEKIAEKKAQEAAKAVVQQYVQQQNMVTDEQRAKAKYADYDYVIENFAVPLIKNDPALAYKIQNSKNPAETAYRLGKLSDEYEEQVMAKQTNPKAEKILKNVNRPVSSASLGNTLQKQTDEISKMSPQEIWSMSQRYAKGA